MQCSLSQSNSVVKRHVNKLYLVERRETKDNPGKDNKTVKIIDKNEAKNSNIVIEIEWDSKHP